MLCPLLSVEGNNSHPKVLRDAELRSFPLLPDGVFRLWGTFDVFLHVVVAGDAGEREEVQKLPVHAHQVDVQWKTVL